MGEIQPLSAEHLARLFDVPEAYLRISLHTTPPPPLAQHEEHPVRRCEWTRGGEFTIAWDDEEEE